MRKEIIVGFENKDLTAYFWDDVKNAKAVVQIIHGMQEHAKRYDHVAKELNKAGFIVFARLLGFIRFAPVLNRKEINTTVKLSLALLLTMMITPLLNPGPPPATVSPMLLLLLNFAKSLYLFACSCIP